MKKNLVLILALALVACGGNNKGNTSVSNNSNEDNVASVESTSSTDIKGGSVEAYFNIFKGGTYHMKAKMVGGGMETIMETYVKDGMSAMKMESGGQSSRMIFRDNKMYMINDDAKTVMSFPATGKTDTQGVKTDGMNRVGSGTDNFNGKDLPYEDYADEEGAKVRYFMDGNKLAGIRNIIGEGAAIDVIVLELDKKVPCNAFEIPSGYKQAE